MSSTQKIPRLNRLDQQTKNLLGTERASNECHERRDIARNAHTTQYAHPALQIDELQHELFKPCSGHGDLTAVSLNGHNRLGRPHLGSARQNPLCIQALFAELFNEVVGGQVHGEDENIGNETVSFPGRRSA